MIILVNGKKAVLKSGFSFEYVAENRLFLGRDGYTLSIPFPLKDCPENIDIFGHVNRMDTDKDTVTFDCEIVDAGVSLSGTLSIVKLSEIEVECQFSEGRCEQVATDPFTETYINEFGAALGTYPYSLASDITPENAWKSYDKGMNAVALPWVNTSYPEAPNNRVNYNGSAYSWHGDVSELSWQPYLLYIAKQICNAIGYEYDFSAWEHSGYKYLIICNTLPASWYRHDFAEALPHWTVSEFFEKLELLLKGEFDFDHRAKSVKFMFSKMVISKIPQVKLQDVVDKYTAEISREDSDCDYIGAKRLAYKDCRHEMSNYYDCDWAVEGKNVKEYPSLKEMIDTNKRQNIEYNDYRGYQKHALWGEKNIHQTGHRCIIPGLMYAQAEKTFFTMRSVGTEYLYQDSGGREHWTQLYALQPVNLFGSGVVDGDDSDKEEIEFCPVCLSTATVSGNDIGYLIFLSFNPMEDSSISDTVDPGDRSSIRQTSFVQSIEAGEKEGKGSAYYDVIYVAFWSGEIPRPGKEPYPLIDPVHVRVDWVAVHQGLPDLRLHGSAYGYEQQIPMIDKRKKFNFSWLSGEIPNPRAIYHIRGKRYVCEKITATFTEHGMSQLLKGEFYMILDS